MPGKRKRRKATSQAQARLFGAVIGGKSTKAKSLTKKQAKDMTKGLCVKCLPKRKRR